MSLDVIFEIASLCARLVALVAFQKKFSSVLAHMLTQMSSLSD